jgi:glycosyltransferase involved in cell wall biosynthesis
VKQITISIITVVYNGEELLEGTIQSILNQTYPNIEYIIVDGQSKDGTMSIINKYADKISHWISEADRGLYDAMNKSLDLATGDFVWFMNAGDHVFASNTIEKMVAQYTVETDILYGEVMLVDDARKHIGTRSKLTTQKLPNQLNFKSLQKGMVVCHQGFLPRRSIAKKYLLDNLAADIDWVLKCLEQSRKNTNTHLILSEYLQGGVSKQQHQQSLKDRYQVLKKHYGFLPNLWNHFWIILRGIWFKISHFRKDSY